MTYTFADELISDLHKDAHGMRPSAAFMDAWLFVRTKSLLVRNRFLAGSTGIGN